MSYSPGYSIDIRAGGDTVLGAFEKYNAEAVKIYGILNELKDNDLTPSELEELKTGNISGSRVTGTIGGLVDGTHITGTIAGGKITGDLPQARIDAEKVTGLTKFVNDIIDDGGESTDKGDGITQSSLERNGYAKFGNGLIVQWGNHDVEKSTGNAQLGDVTFPTGFYSKCYCVMLSLRDKDGKYYGDTAGLSAVLQLPPSRDGFSVAIMPANQSAVTLHYVAIGV